MPEVVNEAGLVKQGNHPNQHQNDRPAQAVDQDIAVHLEPPFVSPRRRTINQAPSPIRINGQVNSIMRPWKISSWPRRKRSPRAISTTTRSTSQNYPLKNTGTDLS